MEQLELGLDLQPPEGVPPEVVRLYERFALQVAKIRQRFSSDAILHRIRWECAIERGDREFKCNDHWTAPLARWFMRLHPEYEGFFETRERRKSPLASDEPPV